MPAKTRLINTKIKSVDLVSNSSDNSTRVLASIHNDHASAVGATCLLVKNDAIASNGTVVFETTAAETNPLLELKNSNAATDKPAIQRFTRSDTSAEADDMSLGTIEFQGVDAGNALGDDPVYHLKEAWIATQETVHSTTEDTVISYVNGGIKFGDYLRTRILELVVHSIDLAQAMGINYEPPKEAMREALYLLADLAVDTPYASKLALISTGREISDTPFNVIG